MLPWNRDTELAGELCRRARTSPGSKIAAHRLMRITTTAASMGHHGSG